MSLKPEYAIPALIGVCSAAVGAALGYRMAKKAPVTSFDKSYLTVNPLVKYASEHTVKLSPAQKKLEEITLKHRKAHLMGSPDELQVLANICRAIGAKKAIDVGTFTGVSALAIAQVLPDDGKVVTCDVTEEYPDVGKPFWKEAGVDKKIDLRIAPADVTLSEMIKNGEAGTYDFAFIDAIKTEYDMYYELCLQLLRPGGCLAFDNMILSGEIINPNNTTDQIKALRAMNDKLYSDDRVDSALLLIGDGTAIAFKR